MPFVILGAENSSNSNRLVEVARAAGCPAAFLASTLEKLARLPLDTATTLGLTAGASTPESFVREAIGFLRSKGFEQEEERTLIAENIHFPLPKEL